MKLGQPFSFGSLKHFVRHHLISTVFIFGFLFDIVILPEVGHFITIILGTSYIFLFSLCLFLRELLIKNNKVDDEEKNNYKLLTFLISFFSGSSLSYMFTYSLRSADVTLAAPFLIIFFIVLISNELISSHRFRLLFDFVLLVISSSLYSIYMMPLITGTFDDRTLSVSIFTAVLFIFFYTKLFSFHSEFRDMIEPKGNALSFSLPLFAMFLALNFLLPPVPFMVEKVIVRAGAQSVEREESILHKLREVGREKVIQVEQSADSVLSYTLVYSLPEDVKSDPVQEWYKKTENGNVQMSAAHSGGNMSFETRSIFSDITAEKGEYIVVTRVGKRVIRSEDIIVR